MHMEVLRLSSFNDFFPCFPGSAEVIMETEAKPKEAEPLADNAEKSETEDTSQTDAGDATTQDSSISNGDDADDKQEMVDLKIIWNKIKYDLKIPVDSTGAKLKERIHSLTGERAQFFRHYTKGCCWCYNVHKGNKSSLFL